MINSFRLNNLYFLNSPDLNCSWADTPFRKSQSSRTVSTHGVWASGESETNSLLDCIEHFLVQHFKGRILRQVKLIETKTPLLLNLTYQVWPWGSRVMSLTRVIWNFCGPRMPCRALKPSRGILLLPVTNWRKRPMSSLVAAWSVYQSHRTCGLSAVYPAVNSVLARKSATK